jgi:hypothetical protein
MAAQDERKSERINRRGSVTALNTQHRGIEFVHWDVVLVMKTEPIADPEDKVQKKYTFDYIMQRLSDATLATACFYSAAGVTSCLLCFFYLTLFASNHNLGRDLHQNWCHFG